MPCGSVWVVANRSQAPCSSRWAKSCQCPVVGSRLFSASSDVLRQCRGVPSQPRPWGGCPAVAGGKVPCGSRLHSGPGSTGASRGQLVPGLLQQRCRGVGWVCARWRSRRLEGGLLGGAGPGGSSRQVWHMVSVRCPQLAFQGWRERTRKHWGQVVSPAAGWKGPQQSLDGHCRLKVELRMQRGPGRGGGQWGCVSRGPGGGSTCSS